MFRLLDFIYQTAWDIVGAFIVLSMFLAIVSLVLTR